MLIYCTAAVVLMPANGPDADGFVEPAGTDEGRPKTDVGSSCSLPWTASDEVIDSSVSEVRSLWHPETQKLFFWHNGFFRWLGYIPVVGNALVGFGPRFVLTLNLSVLLSKGLANNILYYTFLPVFLYRLKCGIELYQRLDAVGGIGWSMKPLVAAVSDVVAVLGYRRRWLLTLSVLLAGVCSICYSSLPAERHSIMPSAVLYTVANYGMANADVLTEGIYSRRIREAPAHGVFLVSSIWWMNMAGSLIGAFIQGPLSSEGYATVGGWIAAVCEFVLLPFFVLNWLEEAPSREEANEASLLAIEKRKDHSWSPVFVTKDRTKGAKCVEGLGTAVSFDSSMDDARNNRFYSNGCGSTDSLDLEEGSCRLVVQNSGHPRVLPLSAGAGITTRVDAPFPSSPFLSHARRNDMEESTEKAAGDTLVEECIPQSGFTICSSSCDRDDVGASTTKGVETERGVELPCSAAAATLSSHSNSCSKTACFSSSTLSLYRYPCFEVNYGTLASHWRIVVLSVGITLGVTVLAVLTVMLSAYTLLLTLVVFSFFTLCLLFWALPPIIAKAGVFIFLSEALYLQLSGPLNSFCLAGPECAPGGPHFDFTIVYTVAIAVSSVAGVVGISLFAYFFSYRSYRFNLFILTILRAAASIFDLILVRRWNLLIGVPDLLVYLGGDAVIYQLVNRLSWMPIALLISQLCPRGSEAMVYALLAAMSNLGSTMATEIGAVLIGTVWPVSFSATDGGSCAFQNLWKLIAMGHIGMPLLLLPLVFFCIPSQKIRESFSSLHR